MKKETLYILFLLLLVGIPHICLSADIIVGDELVYTVQRGDNLSLISAKLGVSIDRINKDNNIDSKTKLRTGQKIRVNTMKIVPQKIDDGIVVNIPDRMLYYFEKGGIKEAFPVALGMPSWRGKTTWRTPIGKFKVTGKRKDPTWHVPPSISEKMALEGKHVEDVVPPGPDNPLGRYALYTSISGIIIHETIWPTSIYRYRSHGCIRVIPENMERFFNTIKINTIGEIIYYPVKLAVTKDKKIMLEVHRDIYGYKKDLKEEAKILIEGRGISGLVDWQKIDSVISEQAGTPVDITLVTALSHK